MILNEKFIKSFMYFLTMNLKPSCAIFNVFKCAPFWLLDIVYLQPIINYVSKKE